MLLVNLVARPALAWIFVRSGAEGLRDPQGRVQAGSELLERAQDAVPGLARWDKRTLVRMHAGVELVGGTMLALGKVPRLAALALAAAMVPSTVVAHAYWTYDDPEQRAMQLIQFRKNVAIIGGLLVAAADTGGRPSLCWRARHAVDRLSVPSLPSLPGH
ncbi:DoxX family protein [Allostreptomyces psammosilenae]|uniref:Putative membrane protein YphA (DoxX/SURF4 family) n=1 Tax=Allostreptomyces psammosilenae TaxID=1892865 RepID=A0A852ZTT2_9ACTN|nr:DoxX family protein [Allostreptomyces psammosilenae]NYI04184.1 putative membrane protein YphA (DoxX/SURF4 family) [Allostreptomyces psammosilenae]